MATCPPISRLTMRVALQVLGQQMGFVWIGHHQAIQLVQAPDGRPHQHRCAVGQVLDAAATGFGQCDRAVFQDEQVVAELAPGLKLAFGHGLAALQEFRKRQTRRLGDHQKVVQVHRHPVGNTAAEDCGDALEGGEFDVHVISYRIVAMNDE